MSKNINPFNQNAPDIQFVAFGLSEILRMGGFDIRAGVYLSETVNGVNVPEANYDPYFMIDGKPVKYQRPLVWTVEDKQLFIESIYNKMNIGTFVIARRNYNEVSRRIKAGYPDVAFHEVVDGKQRLTAIAEFVQGKFADMHGNLFSDMDAIAKRTFMSFNKQSVAILEDPTDDEIKKAFLNVNFAGVPMSKEHIEYVKSINI